MTSMSRARVARRIAAGAAYGGGGIGLAGAAAVGLLLAEAQWARRHVENVTSARVPQADGVYGSVYAGVGAGVTTPSGLTASSGAAPGSGPAVSGSAVSGSASDSGPASASSSASSEGTASASGSAEPPLRLVLLGDSTAAGQGVHRASQTPGALLASGLAAVAERPVRLRNVALPGAQSDDLDRQVSLVLGAGEPVPDICVIIVGANDVTHRMPPTRSVRHLSAAVRRLRTAGAEVVVGTCPDLGTIEPVGQPLRWLARRASRQLAAAQTIGTVEQGGRTVSLGDLLGPEFEANPRELFGPDHYHPSAEGYATAAMAVLPTLCAALSLWPAEEDRPDTSRHEGFLPVARAAAEAAAEPGTEVTAALPTGPRGPWALLKRRRRRLPEPTGTP
ncbi:SGNH/GDSL hydrolase family protein [Streptomyces roseirectus]|uniref:SGNH/GDSL hydrolase family protein n=1 Tax=Streptomyces roseirectus TaxID=2768066 RepID=A0A7H0IHM0_9ACTN|nr:SGNH/GDSL hydrolase family protein [Streptomyces roseirectus]QNP72286.1 SGNH/GDSL hydrolase family protein [Streptomyces roseirectus]